MYATVLNPWQGINPWQSSGFVPQQYLASAQSFLPFHTSPQVQTYNQPLQSATWGYGLPYSSAVLSPAGTLQSGFIPQGAVSYGFNPGWGWQPLNPITGGQLTQINPQMQQQMFTMPALTTGIRASTGFAQPRVELAETNNDVIVTADLPNVDPNNIYITVTDDSLSISALAFIGGMSSSLHRTVALPTSVRAEHLDVSFTNGTLECRLPKSDLAVRRRVKVNAAG